MVTYSDLSVKICASVAKTNFNSFNMLNGNKSKGNLSLIQHIKLIYA